MKSIYKSILFVAIAGIVSLLSFSCNNESEDTPYVSYVRVVNPDAKDSLLVEAPQGQWIVIMGGNLQNTKEVWINDLQTIVRPYYVTHSSVMVTVPSKAPTVVTDKIKLVFTNGTSLLHDFHVKINKPLITSMDCEYAQIGEETHIYGDYFYLPITLTFPGEIEITSEGGDVSVNEDNTILTFKIPAGADQTGQISVKTNFGTTKSDFFFRDDRNIFCSFNTATGGHGTYVTDPGPFDPPIINGTYKRLKENLAAWPWREIINWLWVSNIPDDVVLNPKLYNYKFEVCTMKPVPLSAFEGNTDGFWIFLGDWANGTSKGSYKWKVPIDTQGKWQTITIPFENIFAVQEPFGISDHYFAGFIYNGRAFDCDMSFDNFRIVLKVAR